MNRYGKCLLGMSLAALACSCLAAQEASQPPDSGPPKILTIQREYIKPGRAGAMHDRSESNFVQAMARAKWPTHYVALNSLSGRSRAIYLTGYDSFDAWQKDNDAVMKNSALSAELERSMVADGDLLEGFDQHVFYFQPDLSLLGQHTMAESKYVEVTAFHLHPGHHEAWTEAVKMVMDAHKKAGTNANWAMYELEYGGGEEYLLISLDKGMGEIDQGFAEGKKFREAMGDDGMKKLDALAAECIESSDSELFAINPRQSYVPEAWVASNPEFWKVKPMMASKPAADKGKPMASAKPPAQ